MNQPFSIKVFVAEGRTSGLKTIQKAGWDGFGIICPRDRYPDVKKSREEFARELGGVYVLAGTENGEELVYVGESENVCDRLNSHYADSDKEFWQQAIIFMRQAGAANPMTKTETGYLEARLVKIARDNNARIMNKNNPKIPDMSESDKADAEAYLREMLLLFPVIGISSFEKIEKISNENKTYLFKGVEWDATGYETGGGFAVKKGSIARKTVTPSLLPHVVREREQLQARGVLIAEDNGLRFSINHKFDSPSMAANVVSGRQSSGPDMWKDSAGKTLKENRERAVKV